MWQEVQRLHRGNDGTKTHLVQTGRHASGGVEREDDFDVPSRSIERPHDGLEQRMKYDACTKHRRRISGPGFQNRLHPLPKTIHADKCQQLLNVDHASKDICVQAHLFVLLTDSVGRRVGRRVVIVGVLVLVGVRPRAP